MPEDPNLELLSMIHLVQSASLTTQEMLEVAISRAVDENLTLPVDAAAAIFTLLRLQSSMIANLTEQNQEIVDRVEAIVIRLES